MSPKIKLSFADRIARAVRSGIKSAKRDASLPQAQVRERDCRRYARKVIAAIPGNARLAAKQKHTQIRVLTLINCDIPGYFREVRRECDKGERAHLTGLAAMVYDEMVAKGLKPIIYKNISGNPHGGIAFWICLEVVPDAPSDWNDKPLETTLPTRPASTFDHRSLDRHPDPILNALGIDNHGWGAAPASYCDKH